MKGTAKALIIVLPASFIVALFLLANTESVNSYLGTTNASNLLLLLLVSVDVFVPLAIRWSEKQDDKRKLLLEHSGLLINEAKSAWTQDRRPGMVGLNYVMEFGTATYEPHGGSMNRLVEPPHFAQLSEHLQHGYPKLYALMQDVRVATAGQNEKVIAFWNGIEQSVLKEISTRCPTLAEWNMRGTMPMNSFAIRPIVAMIYDELEFYQSQGSYRNSFMITPTSGQEGNFFSLAQNGSTAQSLERSPIEQMSKIAYGIRNDSLETFLRIEANRDDVEKKVSSFKQAFSIVVDDFEYGHICLKGTCSRCLQLRKLA